MSLKSFFLQPIDDLAYGIEANVANTTHRPIAIFRIMATAVVTWWLYVPVHELLHVFGCLATGGSVTELQIKAIYGGAILAQVFPFVVCGGEYAGRLTGFDTHGSDLVYLATDAAPFVLSILIGVPLLRASGRKFAPGLFGFSIVLGLAPLLNLTGDYYEMGSIMTSWVVQLVGGDGSEALAAAIRSDDVFRVLEDLGMNSGKMQIEGASGKLLAWVAVAVSSVVAVILAWGSYAAGVRFADLTDRSHRGDLSAEDSDPTGGP